MKKIKEKWGITSNVQLAIIFIVFGITGSLSVRLSGPVLSFLHILPDTFPDHFFGQMLYWVLRILVVFPVYQVLLISIGTLFFQYKFFWNFEKKMLRKMGFGFLLKSEN